MARPKVDINKAQVEELAKIGCTNTEIAGVFGVSEKTIRSRFSEILTKGRAGMKKRLRQKQYDVAMKGNVAMLIWLGKQMLGQADKQELGGMGGGPLRYVVDIGKDEDAGDSVKA